jgi:hypothetical protein
MHIICTLYSHYMHISAAIFNPNRITNVEDIDKILFRLIRKVRLSLSYLSRNVQLFNHIKYKFCVPNFILVGRTM